MRRWAQRAGSLWRRLTGRREQVPEAPSSAIVHQVLDPQFLRARLDEVRQGGADLISDEQYEQMYAERDRARESPRVGADATQGTQAYLPRSAAVSTLQSTLTDCVVSRFKDLVEPLPPGKRSFAEFVLREEDVFRQ